jgi:tRNA A-37 threonylcarbamoyl transferase component Bud32
MGKVIRHLADGTVPAKTIFDRRFVAECCETFHLHWRNLRLELSPENWKQMLAAFLEADRVWRANGSPDKHPHLELTRFLRNDEALNSTAVGAELCENLYKTAPPPFGDDAEFYEEDEFVHFHYRDLRVEMSVEDFLAFSGVMAEARERLLEVRPDGAARATQVEQEPTLAELFAKLDDRGVAYAVSRNWENLPDAVEVGPHSDLDLLVDPAHLHTLQELWKAEPTNLQTNPAQRRVPVTAPDGSQSFILVDLRAAGDGYFPDEFSREAVETRTRHEHGFWTLAPKAHFHALAYHVVHHKGVLNDDYKTKLLAVAAEAGIEVVDDGAVFPQLVRLLGEAGIAFQKADDPYVAPKLPYARPVETVLHSRHLLTHGGMQVHSRIYEAEHEGAPAILKQATADLAQREARILSKLDSTHFPRVLDVERRQADSLLTLELIDGKPLSVATPDDAFAFAEGCVEILAELRAAGITHRDITTSNLIVRDGQPVLIDFGWALAPGHELSAAVEEDLLYGWLGSEGRPPEHGFTTYSDTYAMGVALKGLAETDERVAALVTAATAPEAQRVTDPATLAAILAGTAAPPAVPAPAKREFTLLVFADEVRHAPGVLAAVASPSSGVAQLVLYAPDGDAEALADELGPAFERPGLEEVDVVLLAVPRTTESEETLAGRVDAVLTARPVDGPLAELPRMGLAA